MYSLGHAPWFARRRAEILSLRTIPAIELPASVEAAVAAIGAADAPPGARPTVPRLWLECVRAMRPLLQRSALTALLTTTSAACSSLAAVQLLKPQRPLAELLAFAFAYFAMNTLAQVGIYKNGRLRGWIQAGVESHLVALISRKVLRLSAVAVARQSTGNLKVLVTSDVRHVGDFVNNAVRNLIPALTGLVVITPLLVHFSGNAGWVGLGVMAAILPLSLALNQISMRYQDRSQAALDALTSLAGEWVKNIRLIRYLSWDESFRGDVAQGVRKFMGFSMGQHFMACLIFGLSTSWWMFAITGVVLAAHLSGIPLDLTDFFGSLWLLTFLAGYFTHLPNTIRHYGEAAPSMRRIARLLQETEQLDALHPDSAAAPKGAPRKLIFENVTFRHGIDGKTAIRELSLEIPLARKLAVIGEIGSGKTTLLKLICGEYPPTEGRIRVEFEDGETRDLWSRSTYEVFRSHLAYVPQESFVSSDRLRHNISLDAAEAATEHDRAIIDAAYWAELEADLAAFPRGIDQELGEGGVNLSGGQRQRLNLARAKFARRDYLVLDDTLSAVDVKTETALMERLAMHEKGFLLVTHRTGELMRVEEVLVMKDGRVVERGSPRELAADPASQLTRVLKAYSDPQPPPPSGGGL